MKRNGLLILAILCLLVACLLAGCGKSPEGRGSEAAYSVMDAQGTEVSIPAKPKRIVTLSMGTDETMLGLVEPERLAAVNALLDDPKSSNVTELAEKIPTKIKNPSVEQLLALQPDLIIVPDWGDLGLVQPLREAGVPVIVCKGAKSLTEIQETIRLLAAATGERERGEALCQAMDVRLAAIEEKVKKIPQGDRKSVVLLSLMQTYGGKGSAFDEMCSLAGIVNARSAIGIQEGTAMTKEDLVRANPDILFLPTYDDHGSYDVAAFRRQYLEDPALSTITAIKNGALKEPYEGYLYNNSQDFVLGVQEIAYQVYGGDFALDHGEHLTAVKGE